MPLMRSFRSVGVGPAVWVASCVFVGAVPAAGPARAANAQSAAPTHTALDAELTQLFTALPGRFAGEAPDPGKPGSRSPLFHKIARVNAPQFGSNAVFYHQISRDSLDSTAPFLRKFYVFDRNPARRANSMRAFVLTDAVAGANFERDAAAVAALDPAKLMSFPRGCDVSWTLDAGRKTFVGRVHQESCAFDSAAFRQRVSPEMTYELNDAGFAQQEQFFDAAGKPLFPPTGLVAAARQTPPPPPAGTMAAVLAASGPDEWRQLDPERTLYMQLAAGRVVIELAPQFAPLHVENIKALVRERFFDGLAINRVQDNFVTQWGDADGNRALVHAAATVPPEFTRAWTRDLPFTALPDRDGFAPAVGFSGGFAVAGDPATRQIWMAHCYGALGVGRGNEVDSGNGTELYAVIGHAPRQLDRNIAVVGRVVGGMELLSGLRRGPAPMGFYEQAGERTPILSVRLATDLPPGERSRIELLRTDSPSFKALIEARRNRRDDWYKVPAGYIDLCNVPLPSRSY